MPHHLVKQLRFTRSEFVRCFDGVSEEDGRQRVMPNNSISWIVGHLANQENSLWVYHAQSKKIVPGLNELVGYGKPASTPPLDEMWDIWREVTAAADVYLDTLTDEILGTHLEQGGMQMKENVGTRLLRNIFHYWFHLGEGHGIRQQLGHTDLPNFVGDITPAAW